MKTLLVVDVQNDFCPGGSLAVPDGDKVVDIINKIRDNYELVIFTLDTHPEDHCSFKENGGLWPPHCVVQTEGHKLHKDIITKPEDLFVVKGTNKEADSYSGFKDDNGKATTLDLVIEASNIDEVDICGLASEYCVAFTAQDAISSNLKTNIITDGCRCIDKATEEQTFSDLKDVGVNFKVSYEL